MSINLTAANEWMRRSKEETFDNLNQLHKFTLDRANNSLEKTVASSELSFKSANNNAVLLQGKTNDFTISHWAFNQLCERAGAPADYMRKIPSQLVAACLDYGFKLGRGQHDETALMLRSRPEDTRAQLAAATSTTYGRVWDHQVADAFRELFGDGKSGRWHRPTPFNDYRTDRPEHSTFYSGDRDMFVFLCDGDRDIEIPNRRNGQPGRFQRGVFGWNSEVGARSYGLATFTFDFMCENHMIHGFSSFEEIRKRHTAGAPTRWAEDLKPALKAYAEASDIGLKEAIKIAQERKLGDKMEDFISKHFNGQHFVGKFKAVHELEEQRPIETMWDVTVAATAYAKSIPWVADRVTLERQAGKILQLA